MSTNARFPLHVLATCSLLAACVTTPPQTILDVQCLPMASYTRAEQERAAAELESLPPGSMLARFVVDYGALRAANRACEAADNPPH